jgi:hypothetical protein
MIEPKRISLASGTLGAKKVLYATPPSFTSEVYSIKISHLDKLGAAADVTIYKKDQKTGVEVVVNGKDITYSPGFFSEDDTLIVMNAGDTISGEASADNLMQYLIEGREYQPSNTQ